MLFIINKLFPVLAQNTAPAISKGSPKKPLETSL